MLGVVNVVGSTIARECEGVYLHAGPEISVASTKVFTSMLASLGLLALYLARVRDLGPADGARVVAGLRALPEQVAAVLEGEDAIRAVAERVAAHDSAFFIGRHRGYPVALEGAQKLKEVSYVHAEAYPASELKHGPLALVSPDLPVVAVAPRRPAPRQEPLVGAAGARPPRPADRGDPAARREAAHHAAAAAGEGLFDEVLTVPACEPELAPVLLTVPLQLLAYHAAVALDRDADQPRNLAKSVTVE